MRLRLFIVLLVGAAFLAANANAAVELHTVARKGVKTSSRSATGSCGFENDYTGRDDLLLRCRGSSGRAKARYDFSLPKKLYGKPTMHVYGEKLCCSSSNIKRRLVRVSARHYRIVVSVSNPTRYDLRSVSLSYYVTT
jgi:hypothetical protein